MREILSHFQYLSPPQLWECRGTPHALHERWGVEQNTLTHTREISTGSRHFSFDVLTEFF